MYVCTRTVLVRQTDTCDKASIDCYRYMQITFYVQEFRHMRKIGGKIAADRQTDRV